MRIVYCLTDSSLSGGMERAICTKASYLAQQAGYDVTIITTDRKEKPNFFDFSDKIKFIDLDINYSDLGSLSPLKRFVKQIGKRKLHKKKLTEVLVNIKPHICISTYTHEFTLLPSINDGSAKVAEIHFSKPYKQLEFENEKSYLKRFFALAGERNKHRFINRYDCFVVLTEGDRKKWTFVNNIEVIPNSLPFHTHESSNCKSKRVISVGRLSTEKGFEYLIKAWQLVAEQHRDWKLDIFGEGALETELRNLIDKLGIEKQVSIHRRAKSIADQYLQNSVYVMSSIYEGFGLTLAEAMSCGLPAVSFDCPSGPAEIITEGKDGFLVKTANYQALAEKIIYLIENETVRTEMGNNARMNMQRFAPEKVMPRWIGLFEQIAKDNENSSNK